MCATVQAVLAENSKLRRQVGTVNQDLASIRAQVTTGAADEVVKKNSFLADIYDKAYRIFIQMRELLGSHAVPANLNFESWMAHFQRREAPTPRKGFLDVSVPDSGMGSDGLGSEQQDSSSEGLAGVPTAATM